ncbi:MAG TPA: GDSL-type esterase/lipase family protein, partial [Micropruina sp.]|nr:GDSL-type esterase/lipase family protein [Micropruina sp.]
MLRLSRAIGALIVTLALVSGVAPAATAAEPLHRQVSSNDYVALGDSFAAGYGAGIPSGACGRSSFGYPSLIAKIGHLDLTLAACSGATMADVARTQLSALTDGTDFVTIQVGGNDV